MKASICLFITAAFAEATVNTNAPSYLNGGTSYARHLMETNNLKQPETGVWEFEGHNDASIGLGRGTNVGSCYNGLYSYYTSFVCDTAFKNCEKSWCDGIYDPLFQAE